jgi:hypothetical protein
MNQKTIYYLGAGASIGALPILDELSNSLSLMAADLVNFITNDTGITSELKQQQHILENLARDLKWLSSQAANHQTVDTLAKKYYLTDNIEDLIKLKKSLIAFFQVTQLLKRYGGPDFRNQISLDKRYDSLIATIAQKGKHGIELDAHYGIITWNYDIQFELSLMEYENTTINGIKRKYQIHPMKGQLDLENYSCDIEKFAMFKLNGNALWDQLLGAIDDPVEMDIDHLLKSSDKYERLKNILLSYSKSGVKDLWYFTYAWENSEHGMIQYSAKEKMFNDAEALITKAHTLIVVGYSFPAFNEIIDRRILQGFNGSKIIIQDRNPHRIEERLRQLIPMLNEPSRQDYHAINIVHEVVMSESPPKYFPFV